MDDLVPVEPELLKRFVHQIYRVEPTGELQHENVLERRETLAVDEREQSLQQNIRSILLHLLPARDERGDGILNFSKFSKRKESLHSSLLPAK